MARERRRDAGALVFGAALVILGVLFLLQTTGVLGWGVWGHLIRFWPVLLIVFGLNLWLGGRRPVVTAGLVAVTIFAMVGTAVALDLTEDDPDVEGGTLSVQSIFGSAERTIRNQQFDGGEANSIFGSVELDLREANHPGGTIALELNSVFGSVEVRVPREWDVRIDGTPVLGSVDDQRVDTDAPEGAPVLLIEANAVFGSVTVRN